MSLLIAGIAVLGCQTASYHGNIPPQMLMHPGPGVDGPGPGIIAGQASMPMQPETSQVDFKGPDGTTFLWDISAPGAFDSEPLVAPGRYNFPQGAIYRLKMANIPGRPGVELYPTLEVAPTMPRTNAFLAHNTIPVLFTEEDFDQVLTGNFVTKVIYLPDPQFQELALAGVDTLVSTRLDPGVDPIVEAQRRGAILAIVRLGNKDLQAGAMPMQEGGVTRTSYQTKAGNGQVPGAPMAMGAAGVAAMGPNAYVSGYTAPQYGQPMCGTPIGLPGPPSVPLGVPAGLQKHVIVNHTNVCVSNPTVKERIDVKEVPGYHYSGVSGHTRIVERNRVCRDGAPCVDDEPCVNGSQQTSSSDASAE